MSLLNKSINAEIGRRDGERMKQEDSIAEQKRVVSALHRVMQPEVDGIRSLDLMARCDLGSNGITLSGPRGTVVLAVSSSSSASVNPIGMVIKGATIQLYTADHHGKKIDALFQIHGVTSPDGEALCDANGLVDKPIPTAIGLIEELLRAYLRDFDTYGLTYAVPQPPAAPMEHHLTLNGHIFHLQGEPGQACSIESEWVMEPIESGDALTNIEQTAYAVLEAQILALYSEGVLIQNNAVNPAVLRSLQTVMDELPNIVDRFDGEDSSEGQVPANQSQRG